LGWQARTSGFLLLSVFREQLFAALVGGRNSGFIVAPLDDYNAGMANVRPPSSQVPGIEKAGYLFRFPAWVCRGWAAGYLVL